jgi:hypothetical protein
MDIAKLVQPSVVIPKKTNRVTKYDTKSKEVRDTNKPVLIAK